MAKMLDHYVVVGNPIQHSKSPQIHRLFAEQTQQALTYETLLAPLDGFTEAVTAFRKQGGKGCNVTVPFKLEAWQFATQRSERADRAQAVNTLKFSDDGDVYGDNTDGVGLVTDLLHNHAVDLNQRRILILGAGGAVRGIVAPLLAEHPQELVIANRTLEKAEEIVAAMRDLGPTRALALNALAHHTFDLIINGTSAGLTSDLPPLPAGLLAPHGVAYDLVYAATDTPFVTWAKQQGASLAVDGLGMLVEQAAEAFYVWRGIKLNTRPVIQLLNQQLRA